MRWNFETYTGIYFNEDWSEGVFNAAEINLYCPHFVGKWKLQLTSVNWEKWSKSEVEFRMLNEPSVNDYNEDNFVVLTSTSYKTLS